MIICSPSSIASGLDIRTCAPKLSIYGSFLILETVDEQSIDNNERKQLNEVLSVERYSDSRVENSYTRSLERNENQEKVV